MAPEWTGKTWIMWGTDIALANVAVWRTWRTLDFMGLEERLWQASSLSLVW